MANDQLANIEPYLEIKRLNLFQLVPFHALMWDLQVFARRDL